MRVHLQVLGIVGFSLPNMIECDYGKLKRIIGATLGFKSMKATYATIKGVEVMCALRKGQIKSFYFGTSSGRDVLGEPSL